MKKIVILAAAMLAVALFNRPASAQTDAGTPSDGSAVSLTATPQALASGTSCVVPASELTCPQWTVLVRCLAGAAAAQTATCTDLSDRAQEAARRAILACRGQSAELATLRAQLATVTGERDACLQRESNPSRREVPAGSRSVRLPNCLGSSGLYCRAGGRVLMGEACRASRGSLQTAWCACAPGYRIVRTPESFGRAHERLTAGWLCAAVLPGGGVLMPSNAEIERMVRDHETRLTTLESQIRDLCTVQVVPDGGSESEPRVSCAGLRVLIDRAREAAGTGDAPDLTEIRSQIVALEAIVADHRRQIGGIQSVLAVPLCGLRPGEIATVENCRPATGGGHIVGGRTRAFRLRPFAGYEYGTTSGVSTHMAVAGAQGRVSMSNSLELSLELSAMGGRFAAHQIESAVGWRAGVSLGYRFRLAGNVASFDIGYLARMFNDTGVRTGAATPGNRFGDWLGTVHTGQLGLAVELGAGFGLAGHVALGAGEVMIGTDRPNEFQSRSGIAFFGGLDFVYNL